MHKKQETKRSRSILVQAWLDPQDDEDAAVIKAIDGIQKKHDLSIREIVMKSILVAAESDGIEIVKPASPALVTKMLKGIQSSIDKSNAEIKKQIEQLASNGTISVNAASDLANIMNGNGVRFTDLDTGAQSLANNYTGFSINDDEGDDDE